MPSDLDILCALSDGPAKTLWVYGARLADAQARRVHLDARAMAFDPEDEDPFTTGLIKGPLSAARGRLGLYGIGNRHRLACEYCDCASRPAQGALDHVFGFEFEASSDAIVHDAESILVPHLATLEIRASASIHAVEQTPAPDASLGSPSSASSPALRPNPVAPQSPGKARSKTNAH